MSAAPAFAMASPTSLLERLPAIAGRIQADAPLAPTTWFRVGGPAEALVRPASAADLARFLGALPHDVPLTVLGAASNVIVRDGGIPGVVIRLARGFSDIRIEEDGLVAGAACLDATVASAAAEAGLAGLEFLSGIPGQIGGAVAMNAGAYGSDVAAILDWAEFATRSGELVRRPAAALALAYRHASLPPGAIVTRARFRARRGDKAAIAAEIANIRASREATQPTRARTGGSTFRNPPHQRAWELIDAAGLRGHVHGGAQVSDKHCNFFLNLGTATAADIEGLGEHVRTMVKSATGTLLEWEIKRLGVPALPGRGIQTSSHDPSSRAEGVAIQEPRADTRPPLDHHAALAMTRPGSVGPSDPQGGAP